MLRLPLTSTLLATLLLGSDGLQVTPEVIMAVVVAYVVDHDPADAGAGPADRLRWPAMPATSGDAVNAPA